MKFVHVLGLMLLFVFALGIYTLTLRGVPGNVKATDFTNNLEKSTKPFELSPERGRYILTMSLGDDKSFSLRSDLAEAARPDVGYYKGKLYVFFAPGISLMALPFYTLGKTIDLSQVFAFFMISIFAALNVVMLFLISKNIVRLPTWGALLSSLIFGFATTAWSYAITMYQHQVTVFFILSSFYAVWKYRQQSPYSWLGSLYAWTCFGLAIAIDYPNFILMLPIMIYLGISAITIKETKNKFNIKLRLSLFATSIIFLFIMGLHGYYNNQHFGSWTKLSGSLVNYNDVKKQNLNTKEGQDKVIQIANSKTPASFFTEQNLPKSNFTLLFSSDRGLFFFMPILVLGLFGIWNMRKKITLEFAILLGLIGVNIFLYSSWGDPWGGWAYGPRYLIPTMAYLSIFAAYWVSQKYNLIKIFLTFNLFAFSSAVALLGALTTNAVPPKVEADFYHWKYNFLFNLDIFGANRSGSFIYNTYLSHYLSLSNYFLVIYSTLILSVIVLLFILPLFKKDESND